MSKHDHLTAVAMMFIGIASPLLAHAASSTGYSPIITVDTRVGITSPPQSQTTNAGANVMFTVAVAGVPPFSYQWWFNGQNLAGQTAASLTLTSVQFANAGGYAVVVTNAYGAATSAGAQLTVFTNLAFTQTNRWPTTNEIGQSTIPSDPTHFKVYTNGMFQSGVALNPNVMTVVLTHGWNSSLSEWANSMAYLIQANLPSPPPNIVAWDWSLDASSAWYNLGQIADKTPGEGWALSRALAQSLGANYSRRFHFIGHSLGTLVNGAAAEYLQGNGYPGTNMQMTLFDEAEVAWGFDGGLWKSVTTVATLSANLSTPTGLSFHRPLPKQFAWADNYISAFGLLHPEAVNVILTNGFPASAPDPTTLYNEVRAFHGYPYGWYDATIQTDVSAMGFRWSFERGGFTGAPATNTFYIQAGSPWNLVATNFVYGTQLLDARFQKYWAALKATGLQTVGNAMTDNGQVTGQMLATGPANAWDMIINLQTGGGGSPLIQSLNVKSIGGPVPLGGNGTNAPAYAWIPLTVPSNVVSMSFNFMLQGNGNQDSFQVALRGTNILSLETCLIQTNVTLKSGLIDVSPYAGQQVELFLGIVGGTSTNAALTVSDFQFYATLPPSLQIQLSGTNVILTWPMSAAGYVLQATDKLTPTNSWTTVTNMPVIVDFQYAVTNQISGGSRFYRLATVSTAAPTLQAQLSGNNFILSWPTNATGFTLEYAASLSAASWTTNSLSPAVVSGRYTVTNPITSGTKFYRLKK